MKILTLVHNHQLYSVGGAENAAFALHHAYGQTAHVIAYLLAAVPTTKGILKSGEIRSISPSKKEYIIGTSANWMPFVNSDPNLIVESLRDFLSFVNPDIIHIQHYLNFGIDIILILSELSPRSRIVVTLHEYFALCAHNGQLIKADSFHLCQDNSPQDCSACFPHENKRTFYNRNFLFYNLLNMASLLVSPSKTLVDLYVQCDYRRDKFVVIENGLPKCISANDRRSYLSTYSPSLDRFAFFGQINPYKGVDVLLESVVRLVEAKSCNFSVKIYGANLKYMADSFQAKIQELLDKCGDRVSFVGSYVQDEIGDLMGDVDWVIVPSKWWENSPVVIQEAFYFYRPVIGSNIGGIKEKIDGRGGCLFRNNSPRSLAQVIATCIGNSALHSSLVAQIPEPFLATECAERHLDVFRSLTSIN